MYLVDEWSTWRQLDCETELQQGFNYITSKWLYNVAECLISSQSRTSGNGLARR